MQRARALRRRRAQPACVQDLGRPRVLAAAAAAGAVAALAQPGAAARGGGHAGEPRHRRVAPRAPAAGRGLAANRAVELVSELLRSRIRDIPDYPKPGILFKDITPL